MIGIVDYGAGNLRSVEKALRFCGWETRILSDSSQLSQVERVIFPGVGAFGHAVERLDFSQWRNPLKEWIREDRPFLGICLGLQLLFFGSEEAPGAAGLGIFTGVCRRFQSGKVPQIGWNHIQPRRETELFYGIPSNKAFYFVNSYYAVSENSDIVLAESEYGMVYPSVVGTGRIFGVQFHPEKSGPAGLKLLRNWVTRC
jgi:imidazole glycerol phosphate synthase glutamine amidotransferase subunit